MIPSDAKLAEHAAGEKRKARQALVRVQVKKREVGEAESIAKARKIEPNARYATRSIR